MRCAFCGEKLDPGRFKTNEVFSCPKCGVPTVITDERDYSQWQEAVARAARHEKDVDVQIAVQSYLNGDREIRLVQAWSPKGVLSVTQVARILDLSVPRVSNMLAEQERGERTWFPGAFRQSTRPKRYKRGRWKIPREAVKAYLAREHKEH